MKLQVEYVPIDSIKPYERNAKLHPKEQIEQIKASMQEFGNIDPIGVWHNEIVEGHGRHIAAKELGMKEIPIIRLDQLTDEQRRAYALAHNKLTMNSGFDKKTLEYELAGIFDIDMEMLGFEMPKEAEYTEQPEVEFTEVLGEEHNYVVLYFDNAVDWLQIESILDITPKANLATRKDGKIGSNMKRLSVGRVFNGAQALERMREHFGNIN